MPKLEIGKVSEQNKTGAPVTVDRLLSTLRSRWKSAHETELFQDFEDRVNEIMQGGGPGYKLDPALRIFTFYDEAIIPAGSAQATIRTTRQVCGESPLEILFGFFCSRQQPGSGYVFACSHVCACVGRGCPFCAVVGLWDSPPRAQTLVGHSYQLCFQGTVIKDHI